MSARSAAGPRKDEEEEGSACASSGADRTECLMKEDKLVFSYLHRRISFH